MKKDVITVKEYCQIHRIDAAFIDRLEESGLVRIVSVNRQRCIPHEALDSVERFANWHFELEVNSQGLEVANTLYERVLALQEEIAQLRVMLKNT